MRIITLSDDQFARLDAIAELYHRTPEQLLVDWLDALPGRISILVDSPPSVVRTDDYDRRWDAFMQLVGSVRRGEPLSSEEIDELIGEEAAETHDAGPATADRHFAQAGLTILL